MHIGPYDFRPTLWPSLATLVLLPVLIGLGYWQLQRAAWKQALVDAHAARITEPARPLQSLLASPHTDAGLEYRQVTAQGVYDLDHQLLLDNQVYQGTAGYHVLTPLHLDGAGPTARWVLVNRGWVPLGASRAQLPAVTGPAGHVMLHAMIKLPPEKTFRLGAAEEHGTRWPQVIQEVAIGRIGQRVGHPLLPLVLLLDKSDHGGFVRDWRPVYGITPERHRAYAAQWFTLALVLLVIYIGVNTRRSKHTGGNHT
jgi:surfeit locus 1 family protein